MTENDTICTQAVGGTGSHPIVGRRFPIAAIDPEMFAPISDCLGFVLF
jgi:hypothetical protein